MRKGLEIKHLTVATKDGKQIIKDISLHFSDRTNYALLGHNGCGKTTLVSAIMGSPEYQVVSGQIRLDETDITDLPPNERAKLGIFLAMQSPIEIPISYSNFLRSVLANIDTGERNFFDVLDELKQDASRLGFDDFDPQRQLNAGFSGGEKKKSEILQMLAIRPRFALLDEPDSGLDRDSVSRLVERLLAINYPTSLIVISHHDHLLNELKPTVTYNLEEL